VSHSDFFSVAAQPYLSGILSQVIKTRGCIKVVFQADAVEWSCEPPMVGSANVDVEASSGMAPILPHPAQISPNLIIPLIFNCQSISFSHKSLRYFFKSDRNGIQFLVHNLIANLSTKSSVTIRIDNNDAKNHPDRGFYNQLHRHYFNALRYWFADDIPQTGDKIQELVTINAFVPIINLLTGYLGRESEKFRRNINLLRLESQDSNPLKTPCNPSTNQDL